MAKKPFSPTRFNAEMRQTMAREAPPVVAPSLAEQIIAARHAAETFIESKVDQLKALPEGKSIPRDWIALNIYAVNRSDRTKCFCKCALQIIEKDGQ
jgi:hypothetical protein